MYEIAKEDSNLFKGEGYMTKGVQLEVPVVLQLFMWDCIRVVPEPDYLQIFRLSEVDGKQKIAHELEIPAYKREKADKEFAFAHNDVLYNDDTLRKEKLLLKTYILSKHLIYQYHFHLKTVRVLI